MATDSQEVKQLWIKRHHFAEFCFAGKGEWGWVGGLATRCLTVYACKRAPGEPVRHSPQLFWSLPDVSGRKWCRNVGQPPQQDAVFFGFSPRLTPPLALLQWSWKGGQSQILSLSDWLASLSRTNWQTCYLCDCPPAVWIHIVLEVGLISGRKDAVCTTSRKRLLHFSHSVEKKRVMSLKQHICCAT